MNHGRRFTPGRIVVFLMIILILVALQGNRKIPAGPAEGASFEGTASTTQPAGPTLRVATFNIDGGAEGLDKVAHALQNGGGFDLAGLEEVHGADQTQYLGDQLRESYLYAPVETQWWTKSFGNAAITDLPITHWQRIPISANDSDSNRNVILVSATFAGRPLNILITHIDRHQDHAAEIRDVANLFLSLQEPAILMGDFNVTENDSDIAALAATQGVIDPIGKDYDRIFVRGLTVVDSGFVEEHASDHPMAWAELKLK
jgi:endonuclease/exonuclease/phosphatase family metal-dependent hydrolase